MTPAAHHDCPACAACKLRVAVTIPSDVHGPALPAPWLYCPACGHRWEASAEDRAQAERADAAWIIESARQWAPKGGAL